MLACIARCKKNPMFYSKEKKEGLMRELEAVRQKMREFFEKGVRKGAGKVFAG